MITGTIDNYVKYLDLQKEWQNKKQNLNTEQPKGSTTGRQQDDSYISTMKSLNKPGGNMQSMITQLLFSGKKLSPSEMEFLRNHHPELYVKAVQIERDREDYNRELKRCRTKDEVRQAHLYRMQSFMSEVKSAQYGGNPTAGFDIQTRLTHITDEYNRFLESKTYQKLRWQNEKLAAKAQKRKVKRVRIKI